MRTQHRWCAGMWVTAAVILTACEPRVPPPGPTAPAATAHSDWNGRWLPWSSKPRPAEVVFDPEHFYSPPDPVGKDREGEGLVGPLEGTYLTEIPYNVEWAAKYEKNVRDEIDGHAIDHVAVCEPYGFPRVMGGNPSGPEIVVLPEVVLMVFDLGSAIRHIYTDGREHPTGEGFDTDVSLRWNGHSVGKWEGDALVVDTVGVYPSYYDQTAAPHSDRIHVLERIRLVSNDRLEDEMTIEDPLAFTRPWKVTRYFVRGKTRWPDVRDSTCSPDNNIRLDANGYQEVVLPSERESLEKGKR